MTLGPTGKTLLAKRLPTILPPLTPAESLQTTRIYSAMGLLKPGQALMAAHPFRPPHHSVSDTGLVGGGTTSQSSRHSRCAGYQAYSSIDTRSDHAQRPTRVFIARFQLEGHREPVV